MGDKLVENNQIKTEEELDLYLQISLLQGKYQESLEIAEGNVT